MNFKSLNIKYSYESGKDDLINDFYLPALEYSVRYDRIAGFFSSSSLAIAARGIAGLIGNGGRVRMLVCPKMKREDILSIEKAMMSTEEIISQQVIEDINAIEDNFKKDHISALGWLVANGFMEIKVVLVLSNGRLCTEDEINEMALFHQKIGILYDIDGNIISFSGSINETASGWLQNIEEFKVFRSWEDGQKQYLKDDITKFDEFWNQKRFNAKVIDIPKAIKDKLIQYGQEFDICEFDLKRHLYKTQKQKSKDDLGLFFYQKKALCEWINNGYKMLIEMATGTGKTRTAIACVVTLLKNQPRLIVIISCPQTTLSQQWYKEITNLGINMDRNIIADSSNSKWKNELNTVINKVAVGYDNTVGIFTTHQTCSSAYFIRVLSAVSKTVPICFIGDETHGLGASKTKNGLLESYKYRIGLSATPNRWFDEFGTEVLKKYFGCKTFEFTIEDALNTINPLTGKPFLVNYYYRPYFLTLTDDEIEEYLKLSNRIKKMGVYKNNSDEYQERYEKLIFERANVQKNAENKYKVFEEIIDSISDIKDTIIFVSPSQIDRVMKILNKKRIIAHRFTQKEGTKSENKYGGISERENLIRQFKEGYYKVLVAIKCLDEGIDIPSASTAILMASSTNPREYIQRIGRVIRQTPNKDRAIIYDLIIKPDFKRLSEPCLIEFEKYVFEKELNRVHDMSKNSINNAYVNKKVYDILGRL